MITDALCNLTEQSVKLDLQEEGIKIAMVQRREVRVLR